MAPAGAGTPAGPFRGAALTAMGSHLSPHGRPARAGGAAAQGLAEAIGATGLEVQPFQRRFLRGAFADGVSIGTISTPRAAGKTELIGRVAGLGVVPGSPVFREGHEVVVFAGSMRQARHVYRAALRALPDPDTYRRRDNNQEIAILGPAETKVNIYPSSGKRALGLGANEHLLIADEPASWNVRDGDLLWAALTGSLGKLPGQRLLVCGTLSPAEPGSWWPELVKAGGDALTYVQLHQAAEGETWDDLRVAERANPLLRVNPALRAVVRAERDAARRDSQKQPRYEAYRLNRHVAAEDTMLLSVREWQATLARPVPPRGEGRCVIGIDVGASRSWSAAWMSFATGRQECIAVIPGVPSPAEQARRDGLPRGSLERLIAAGVLVVDEGRQVARVETLIAALPRDVRVSHVVADRFHEGALRDASRWPVEARVNQWSTASADIAAFRAAVLDGDFAVAEHCQRLAELSFAHARVERDTSGNSKMFKTHRRQRDDVAQAGVLAVAALARMPVRRSTGVYLGVA